MFSERTVTVGKVKIGGNAPIVIQSMASIGFERLDALIGQAKALEEAGCDMLRVSVPNQDSAKLIPQLKKSVSMPIVADIHFDPALALSAIRNGADKIRLNPGNIPPEDILFIAKECREQMIPIRIGINSGSVEKELLKKYGGATPDALVESALNAVSLLESVSFDDIVVSIKSSNVQETVKANKLFAKRSNIPLHLGITEAGTPENGIIKSAAGIGALLLDGIGDTIRISLTGDPVKEVYAAKKLLRAIGLRKDGVEIISCPTCGRTKVDVIKLAEQAEDLFKNETKYAKIAIMGCAVNGPGEAADADFGIAGGNGEYLLFKKGKTVCKISEENALETLKQLYNEI